jgi:hypothetical protein
LLFEGGYEEDEGDRQEEEKVVDRQFGQNQFATFGIIPFVLKYCEVTNETISNVMNEGVNMVFYIVTYEILKAKEQERQLKEIRNKNKR